MSPFNIKWKPVRTYEKVQQSDLSYDSSTRTSVDSGTLFLTTSNRRSWKPLLHAIHLLFDLVLLVLVLLPRSWDFSSSGRATDTHWSPIDALNKQKYHTERWHGSFDSYSPYKGPPSPAVDQAWDKILAGDVAISITEEEFSRINASLWSVEVPKEIGDGRMGAVDMIHQLHCVHELFKHTYPDYYQQEYNHSKANPESWHKHVDHCIDSLRMKIMCDADGGVIPYNFEQNHFMPHPNFNMEHQCRDADLVFEFAKERRLKGFANGQDWIPKPTDKEYVEFPGAPFDPSEDGVHVLPTGA